MGMEPSWSSVGCASDWATEAGLPFLGKLIYIFGVLIPFWITD